MNKYERVAYSAAEVFSGRANAWRMHGNDNTVIENLTMAVFYLGAAGYGADDCPVCYGSGDAQLSWGKCIRCLGTGIVPMGEG